MDKCVTIRPGLGTLKRPDSLRVHRATLISIEQCIFKVWDAKPFSGSRGKRSEKLLQEKKIQMRIQTKFKT